MKSSKFKVRLHMKSGKTITFKCDKITSKFVNGDKLTSLSVEGGKLPFYFRLDEVEAITTHNIFKIF